MLLPTATPTRPLSGAVQLHQAEWLADTPACAGSPASLEAAVRLALPRADTLWQADRDSLTPQTPVTLSFDNGQGLVFHRQIAVDDRYMFTIKDSVENKSDKAVTLAPYSVVARLGLNPKLSARSRPRR